MPNTTTTSTETPHAGMQEGMAEATRLTQAGRLAEATALIQRTLGGMSGTGAPPVPTQTMPWSTPLGAGMTVPVSLPMDLPNTSTLNMPRSPAFDLGTMRAPAPAPTAPELAGRFVAGSYTNQAGTRPYKLYIPSGATGEPLPLLVMLHGCTQNADDFAAGTDMNALAESGNFFVLYPEQSNPANMQKCWNWFKTSDQQRDGGEPSIIAGITRQIAATQPVDTKRIYVAGMSAGGAMAVVMAATHPDLYAAVGVHSGLAYGAAHDMPSAFRAMQGGAPDPAGAKTRAAGATGAAVDLTRTVPTIVFHGDRDGTVHPRNGEQVLGQWSGANASRGGTPRVAVRRGQVPDGHAYTRSVYHDTDEQPVAERWLVHGAGHAWSGGSQRGSYTDPHGPSASEEMVRFFLEHPRR